MPYSSKYAVSAAVTVMILVAMFISLARGFWLGVVLSLVTDAGLIWWGAREFIKQQEGDSK